MSSIYYPPAGGGGGGGGGGDLAAHLADTANPHSVTKSQVGLANVDNTSDANKPVSDATQTALDAKAASSALTSHTSDTANPHAVTKSQVGLGNVDNTSDANKPVSTATQTALDLKANSSNLAIGGTLGGSPTTGSVLFVGASGVFAQDNAQLFWDDTNTRLGVGTATPPAKVSVDHTSAVTNTIEEIARFTHRTSGTPANNIGQKIVLEQQCAGRTIVAGELTCVLPDVVNNSEDSYIALRTVLNGNLQDTVFFRNNRLGIGMSNPTSSIDVQGDLLRLRNSKTPASATASGNQGEICWDADYLYVCTATNTWRRVAHATW